MSNKSNSGNSPLNAVIIGCGEIAGGYDKVIDSSKVRTHALAYTLNEATQLVAVADTDLPKAKQFAKRWKVENVYSDVSRMLEEQRPQLVSICTPDVSHADMLRLCLNSRCVKGVWCEKPLATDIRQAKEIVKGFEYSGKSLFVSYQRRFAPGMIALKSRLQEGMLGSIQKVVIYYTKGILHNGSHPVNLLVDWFGTPRVIEVLHRNTNDDTPEDPTVDALLIFGHVPVYLLGLDKNAYSLFEIHIYGTSGRVCLVDSGDSEQLLWNEVCLHPGGNGYKFLSPKTTCKETGLNQAMPNLLQHMVDAVKSGVTCTDSTSALNTLQICHRLAELGRSTGFPNRNSIN